MEDQGRQISDPRFVTLVAEYFEAAAPKRLEETLIRRYGCALGDAVADATEARDGGPDLHALALARIRRDLPGALETDLLMALVSGGRSEIRRLQARWEEGLRQPPGLGPSPVARAGMLAVVALAVGGLVVWLLTQHPPGRHAWGPTIIALMSALIVGGLVHTLLARRFPGGPTARTVGQAVDRLVGAVPPHGMRSGEAWTRRALRQHVAAQAAGAVTQEFGVSRVETQVRSRFGDPALVTLEALVFDALTDAIAAHVGAVDGPADLRDGALAVVRQQLPDAAMDDHLVEHVPQAGRREALAQLAAVWRLEGPPRNVGTGFFLPSRWVGAGCLVPIVASLVYALWRVAEGQDVPVLLTIAVGACTGFVLSIALERFVPGRPNEDFRVEDVVDELVALADDRLRAPGAPWTRGQIRERIEAIQRLYEVDE